MTGTKDDEAVQRAVIAEARSELLIAELERRGYTVVEGQLPFVWDGDDDGEEALTA